MCPSFRATGEEQHSTRGRARLLHEMLAGEVVTRRLALGGGTGRARPVPVLQGLPQRLPGGRRHGHVQGGVPAPPLRGPAPARRRTTRWAGCRVWLRAGRRRPPAPLVNAAGPGAPAGRRSRSGSAASRRSATSRGWRARPSRAGGAEHGRPRRTVLAARPARSCCGRTPSPTTSRRRWAGRRCGSWRRRAAASPLPPRPGLLRPDVRLDRPARPGPRGHAPHPRPRWNRPLDAGLPGRRPGAELRGGPPHGPARTAGATTRARARLAASVRTFAQALEESRPRLEPPRIDRPVAGQTHCHQHAVLGDAADRRLRERAGLDGRAERRLLRPRGQLRLREGPLRGVGGLRGGPAAARGTGGRAGRRSSWRTASPAVRSWSSWAGARARHLAEVLAEGLESR